MYRMAIVLGALLGLTTAPARAEPAVGVVFVVEGVGGFDLMATSARWALPWAGVPHEVRHFVWTHGKGQILKDLQDIRHVLTKADDLAAEIRRVKEASPSRPIFIVAKSGGTGPALLAASKLPPGTLERIILLSAAVSPDFDLRPALRATRGEIVSFYSTYDGLVLGLGTKQFGTVDRVYGPSAGLRGFKEPEGDDGDARELYQRLVQVPWGPRMLRTGHTGAHAGTSLPGFLTREVAPWLKTTADR